MSELPLIHGTFSIERVYKASPEKVFSAFTTRSLKQKWFAEGEGFALDEYTLDLRVGGREYARFRVIEADLPMSYDSTCLDLVAGRRIVSSYVMTAGDTRLSVSLATVELTPQGSGTRLKFTEQGAFFGSAYDVKQREEGSKELLEKLAEAIGG